MKQFLALCALTAATMTNLSGGQDSSSCNANSGMSKGATGGANSSMKAIADNDDMSSMPMGATGGTSSSMKAIADDSSSKSSSCQMKNKNMNNGNKSVEPKDED